MGINEFRQNLLIYGSNIYNWPVEIKANALATLDSHPGFQALVDDENQFEELLNSKPNESVSPDLAQRIINAAAAILPKKVTVSLAVFIDDLFSDFQFLKPGYALLVILSLGFLLGFITPIDQTEAVADSVPINEFLYSNENNL